MDVGCQEGKSEKSFQFLSAASISARVTTSQRLTPVCETLPALSDLTQASAAILNGMHASIFYSRARLAKLGGENCRRLLHEATPISLQRHPAAANPEAKNGDEKLPVRVLLEALMMKTDF